LSDFIDICTFATMNRFFALLFIIFLCFQILKASDKKEDNPSEKEWKIGGLFHWGKAVKHSPLVAPVIERSVTGGEIFFSKQTYGAHNWNAFFNYPEYGVCFSFLDLGSPNYAGKAQSLYPYINFHLLDNRNPVNINLRTGIGLAYVEKIYNAETNPLNYAFSTNLNVILNAQLQGVYKISNSWTFHAGAGITHFSNGALKMPNLGLNIISLFSGLSYSFGKENSLIPKVCSIYEKNKNWNFSIYLLGGIKEINPIGGKKYFAGDCNFEVTKKHHQYTRFGISLDITHDGSEYDCIVFQSLPPVDRLKTTRIGISGGYEWQLGDFSIDLFFGYYLHEPNPLYGKVYQRTSLRYPLSDRVKLSIAFRNHFGKADFAGIGLGYRITE